MTREEIEQLAELAGIVVTGEAIVKLCTLVAKQERQECIKIIEAYQVPVGNSGAGELACEWTMDALRSIRDEIRARGEK